MKNLTLLSLAFALLATACSDDDAAVPAPMPQAVGVWQNEADQQKFATNTGCAGFSITLNSETNAQEIEMDVMRVEANGALLTSENVTKTTRAFTVAGRIDDKGVVHFLQAFIDQFNALAKSVNATNPMISVQFIAAEENKLNVKTDVTLTVAGQTKTDTSEDKYVRITEAQLKEMQDKATACLP